MAERSKNWTTLESILRLYSVPLADDLERSTTQVVKTTKLDRRQRALSYLLETLTGGMGRFPSEQWCLDVLSLIEDLHPSSPEAQVALERTARRLREALDDRTLLDDHVACVGCGEAIRSGDPHDCVNASAKAKDATMSRDPDLSI